MRVVHVDHAYFSQVKIDADSARAPPLAVEELDPWTAVWGVHLDHASFFRTKTDADSAGELLSWYEDCEEG